MSRCCSASTVIHASSSSVLSDQRTAIVIAGWGHGQLRHGLAVVNSFPFGPISVRRSSCRSTSTPATYTCARPIEAVAILYRLLVLPVEIGSDGHPRQLDRPSPLPSRPRDAVRCHDPASARPQVAARTDQRWRGRQGSPPNSIDLLISSDSFSPATSIGVPGSVVTIVRPRQVAATCRRRPNTGRFSLRGRWFEDPAACLAKFCDPFSGSLSDAATTCASVAPHCRVSRCSIRPEHEAHLRTALRSAIRGRHQSYHREEENDGQPQEVFSMWASTSPRSICN